MRIHFKKKAFIKAFKIVKAMIDIVWYGYKIYTLF